MVFDFLLPAPINWFPFFNTSPANASGNDADFYVSPTGALGIAAIGYSAAATILTNTWYRVAFAADLSANVVTYYVNGAPVCSGPADIDGRHSVTSNAQLGPDLRLFNEGDTTGVYTHAVYLSSFLFTDRTLSPAEIAALGGPKARGILVTPPAVSLSGWLQDTNLVLHWTGEGLFQLQTKAAFPGADWENIGIPTAATNAAVPVHEDGAFFRVAVQE
jgi:hypothetical protein